MIVQKKILIETKPNEIESEMAATNQELDKYERGGEDETAPVLRTPAAALNHRRILNKLNEFYSEKKNPYHHSHHHHHHYHQSLHNSAVLKSASSATTNLISTNDMDVVQAHANSNGLFALTLRVTEANKICNTIGFEFEFKRYEILSQNSSSTNKENSDDLATTGGSGSRKLEFIQMICVVDKRLNLATLWNLETFEHKLSILREIYARVVEEGAARADDTRFITDSTDEWQTLDTFIRQDETFSPRM